MSDERPRELSPTEIEMLAWLKRVEAVIAKADMILRPRNDEAAALTRRMAADACECPLSLITAAPEMLSLLKKIDAHQLSFQDMWREVRNTIAKAEGHHA